MVAVRVDLVPLFDALEARNERTTISEIAYILEQDIAPNVLAGRLSLPAALGDREGTAVPALVAAGRLGDWARVVPPGPEPGAQLSRKRIPGVGLVNAATNAASAIAFGLQNDHPKLPEPLFPKDIAHAEGPWGALRDAFIAGDVDMAGRVLMGFYGSGTDYREMSGSLYSAICAKFAVDALPLLTVLAATQALDSVDWGDRVPVHFLWLLPLIMRGGPDAPGASDVRAYLAQKEHDLDFVRTRLALTDKSAAGKPLRDAILHGATPAVLEEVFGALKRGGNGAVVGAQIAIAAAELLAGVATDDTALLDRAQVALRAANAARTAVTQVQDIRVLPIIFHVANLVNQVARTAAGKAVVPAQGTGTAALGGGLIEYSVLRNIDRQLAAGDEAGVRATVRRYSQMTFPARSLLGTFGGVVARPAIAADANGRGMLITQAAGETFLVLTPQQQSNEGMALIDAIAHVLLTQPRDTALATRVEQALDLVPTTAAE